MFENWKMVIHGTAPIFPEMPEIQVVRGFSFNHLYHHHGEMMVYLRSTGNIVPVLYGPTAEQSR